MAATVSGQELSKMVSTAAESARAADVGDKAQQRRCLDALVLMQKYVVSAAVLKETDAGKKVNRLTKSSDPLIAAAATKVVQSWKDCVKKQAMASGLTPSGSLPELSSQQSLGTATSSGPLANIRLATNGDTYSSPVAPQAVDVRVASGPQRPPPGTGDPKRDKIRKLLCDGLALVPDAHRQGLDPGEVAAEVELAIYNKYGGNTGAEYSSKVRTLSFNLKDANNPNLRTRVLTGVIDPQELLDLSPEDLASDEKRQLNYKIRQEAAAEAVRGISQAASTDMFKCSKCKQRKCTYYQMQTRSADEPMTTFVTCTHCGNKWKFC